MDIPKLNFFKLLLHSYILVYMLGLWKDLDSVELVPKFYNHVPVIPNSTDISRLQWGASFVEKKLQPN